MWAEKKRKRPHEWLEGVLGVLGLAWKHAWKNLQHKKCTKIQVIPVYVTDFLDSVTEILFEFQTMKVYVFKNTFENLGPPSWRFEPILKNPRFNEN
jgi:hypothetical protein